MSLIIKRQSGAIGALGKEKVLINGVHLASIANNSQVDVPLPQSPAIFSLKGVPKSSLEVKDGEVLTITGNSTYFIGIAGFAIALLLSNLVFRGTFLGMILPILGFLSLVLNLYLVPRYNFTLENQ